MSQIDMMLTRVRDVLPQVPIEVIRRDLLITASVDETITRLLDGTVTYVPLAQASTSASTSASPFKESTSLQLASVQAAKLDAASLPSLHVPASSFSKSPTERMKSYQERKQALIDAARIRYMHKLNVHTADIHDKNGSDHTSNQSTDSSAHTTDPLATSFNISSARKGALEQEPDPERLLEENRVLRDELSAARRELAALREESLRHRKMGSLSASPTSSTHHRTEKEERAKGFAMSPYLMAFVALVLGLIFGKLVL